MPGWPNRPNYSRPEVEALLEEYVALRDLDRLHGAGLTIRCWKIDLDRAFKYLTPNQRNALFVVGIMGVPKAAASELLGCATRTVYSRYNMGLTRLVTIMNGRFH
jgi:DNA-directed RNA polymerase specialized sigma24 family protein